MSGFDGWGKGKRLICCCPIRINRRDAETQREEEEREQRRGGESQGKF
jgi:hypothetical protein